MSTQSKKQKKKSLDFVATVREALKLYKKPKELGLQSPLAAPYFLGSHLQSTDTTPEARGQVLANLLKEVIEEDISDPLHQQILEERYLKGAPVKTLLAETGYQRARYNDYQTEAITALGDQLIKRIQPALYLENLPATHQLFERDDAHHKIMKHFSKAGTDVPSAIILAGSGGMGKTSLGSQVAASWHNEKHGYVFWYTIRSGLTDKLGALFFNLASFLGRAGQPTPWLELVAQQGAIEPEPMLGLFRAAIANLEQQPLLCFDEIDMLDANRQGEHGQIIEFINSLRGTASMLWIGQQVRLEADYIESLDGLSISAIRDLCLNQKIHLNESQLTQIQVDTQGNPRLLTLFVALYQIGDEISELLELLHESPSVENLLSRIIQRLNETERQILMQLAVFRGAVPNYIWQRESTTNVVLGN